MKRILLLTILLVSTLSVFAQRVASLRIKLSTNQLLAVSVDDRYYDRRGTSITIGDLPAGRHYLKVYSNRIGRNGNSRPNMVYSGYVDLKPNSRNMAVVDPFQRKMTMRTTQTFDRNDNDVYENWNDRRDNRRNDRDDRYDDRYNDNALLNSEVSDLNGRVQDRSMDGDKLKLVQSVLTNRTYYTEQLRTMLGWFSFESTKLEFAKWAYDNAIDKENYWKLEDVFSFSSSKNELTEYVDARKTTVPVRDNRNRYNDRDYEYNNYNPRAISDQDVTDLGSRVKDRITDSDKLQLVQSVLKGKEYYTDQLRTMLGWFSFESTKLDFAKWAYNQTLDSENYWKLEDVFSFTSSKDELNEYVQSNKR